jgi:hypothetical protein
VIADWNWVIGEGDGWVTGADCPPYMHPVPATGSIEKMITNAGGITIGQLAKAAGVNSETLRYYERIGLISPLARPAASDPIPATTRGVWRSCVAPTNYVSALMISGRASRARRLLPLPRRSCSNHPSPASRERRFRRVLGPSSKIRYRCRAVASWFGPLS